MSRLSLLLTPLAVAPLVLAGGAAPAQAHAHALQESVRFATFNTSMFRSEPGALAADLAVAGDGATDRATDAQTSAVAEIIQRQRPDVVLLNEFDHDAEGAALEGFTENFLEVAQSPDTDPVVYPYSMVFASNTGVPSGFDLNGDGLTGTADDALGFGEFEGQYAFAILSMHPIDTDGVRTFAQTLWKDMPGARLPDDPTTPEPGDFYSAEELEVFRLSSKNHVDVPVWIDGRRVHVLASHPTPPSFDGEEDRNGLRNADEIRFWDDYVTPQRSWWIHDDLGAPGGLPVGEEFVVMGDLNSDPVDGDSVHSAIGSLLANPYVQDPMPASAGAAEQAALQGGANTGHAGDPATDTADFADSSAAGSAPGNLRVDYVLPSRGLDVTGSGVFWPASDDPASALTGTYDPELPNGFPSSDHRMVWVDVRSGQGTGCGCA